MFVMNNLSEVWLEITMIPFLIVFSIFLGGRMATRSKINRRFLLLLLSTLAAACFETVLEIFTDMEATTVYIKIFYAVININAYCLMAYVAAYTRRGDTALIETNFFILCISIILLFMFNSDEKLFMIFSPGFAVLFVVEAFILQLIYQQYYGNGQFIVMNLLFILLIDSFLLQYLFGQNIPLVYTVATMMLIFTFFYLEAPTYRQLIKAHKETEVARISTEFSIQRAEIANKAKSNFLASTSHEIRTPMNAILGINDMIIGELANDKNADPEAKNAAQSVRRAGNYLLNLVNNILDISKIEAGKMDLYENDYHLCEMLRECEGIVIHKIGSKKNIRFVLDADKNMHEHLYGDVLRLKQALVNLLDNAVKYTQKGSITLKISEESEKNDKSDLIISFIVEDTGLGIKEEDIAKIFEPFERVNIVETRHIPGAGLGLNLVKNIVDIMSGTIEFHSKYGEGTKVIMKIPQKIISNDEITIKEYEELAEMNAKAKALEAEKENSPSVWTDAKILVVDDTPVNLVVAKGMLKDSQAKIETAESGEEALEKIKAEHFDIVFLDHKMPGMDGVETLAYAKKYSPDTNYIALTANAGGNARTEYIEMGFDDYLPKPFKGIEMMKILKTFLNKK